MPDPRLDLSAVSKRFGPTTALDGVGLSVAAGEVHAIVGENGAGKSTLMKILSGALMPDAGTMSLEGAPYQPRDPMDARRRGVAMVYQELSLAPHLTVAENILLGVEPSRGGFIRRAGMHAAARAALAQLDRGEIPVDARAGSLPVAVQQLVEIARALAQSDTRVLILDEPTSSLAEDDVRRLFAAIRRLQARGLSVLYISHVLEEVQEIAGPLHRAARRPHGRRRRRPLGGARGDRAHDGRAADGPALPAVGACAGSGDPRARRRRGPREARVGVAPASARRGASGSGA